MIISVASGKGGTGKTTVATNLALSIEKNVQLIDCDVEQPNAHLFIHPVFDFFKSVTTPVPAIHMDQCSRCGKCADPVSYTHLRAHETLTPISDSVFCL